MTGTTDITRLSARGLALIGVAAASIATAAAVGVHPPSVVYAQACVTDPAGGPTCPPPPTEEEEEEPTKTPRPRATRTPTATATSTATPTCDVTTGIGCPSPTPSSTPTITLVPTGTPYPTPSQPPPPPWVELITTIIGKFHPDPQLMEPLPKWLQPLNLQLTDIEITQATQCLHNLQCADNSVPLYDGKLTMVRAYVRIKGGPYYHLYSIGGALCFGNTGNAGCVSPIRPLYKIDVFDESDPVGKFRRYLTYTLDFILPSYMVTGGATKEITVYVNYNFEDEPREGYYKDNYRTLQYQVEASEPLEVMFHLVQNKAQMADFGSIWSTYDYLAGSYPTGQLRTAIGFPLFGKDYPWKAPDGGCGKGWGSLLVDLLWMQTGLSPLPYGLVPAATVTKYGGCGSTPGAGAAGLDDSSAGRIAAQELGHNLNRYHVPGCGAGSPDNNYPAPYGHLDDTGVDVLHRKVFMPAWDYDYMGYCGGSTNSWTSMYTYDAIAAQLPAGVAFIPGAHLAAPLPADAQVLLASGEVSPAAAVVEHGFYRLAAGAGMAATPDDGPYVVELLDAQGHVLADRHFAPLMLSNEEPSTSGPFYLTLPWVDDTTAVVFRYQDQEIGRITASRRAPEAEFTSPSEGQAWTGSGLQTISWTGSDPDDDSLQYLLQYSADGGQSWQILAPNLTATSFEIDASWLPGSEDVRLRLFASDGFHTVSVESMPLQIEGKPPMVHISGPSSDDELFAGAPVALQGAATDLEDGFLGDEALSWSSDRDGALGSGGTALLAGLTEGPHTLTLTAIDSDGNAASESVQIIIQPQPRPEAPASPLSPLWCLAGAIVIGGGALATAFAIGRRSRRRAEAEGDPT